MNFRLFPAFFDKPEKIRFVEQEEDEKIELFLRQHWIKNVPWIVYSIIAILIPVVLLQLGNTFSLTLITSIPNFVLVGSLIVWYMLVLAYALEKFLYWYYNIYIVTNVHLVDIDFISLLKRVITEIELKDIESVRSDISGIIRPLFNFGSVEIETAAAAQNTIFEDVPSPDVVADRIEDLRPKGPGGGD